MLHDFTHICNIKNKSKLKETDNRFVVTRRKRGWRESKTGKGVDGTGGRGSLFCGDRVSDGEVGTLWRGMVVEVALRWESTRPVARLKMVTAVQVIVRVLYHHENGGNLFPGLLCDEHRRMSANSPRFCMFSTLPLTHTHTGKAHLAL